MKMNERLKMYRKERGITQEYVARKTGISNKRLSFIENGHTKLTVDDFETICVKGYGVSPKYFFTNRFLDSKNKEMKV